MSWSVVPGALQKSRRECGGEGRMAVEDGGRRKNGNKRSALKFCEVVLSAGFCRSCSLPHNASCRFLFVLGRFVVKLAWNGRNRSVTLFRLRCASNSTAKMYPDKKQADSRATTTRPSAGCTATQPNSAPNLSFASRGMDT